MISDVCVCVCLCVCACVCLCDDHPLECDIVTRGHSLSSAFARECVCA